MSIENAASSAPSAPSAPSQQASAPSGGQVSAPQSAPSSESGPLDFAAAYLANRGKDQIDQNPQGTQPGAQPGANTGNQPGAQANQPQDQQPQQGDDAAIDPFGGAISRETINSLIFGTRPGAQDAGSQFGADTNPFQPSPHPHWQGANPTGPQSASPNGNPAGAPAPSGWLSDDQIAALRKDTVDTDWIDKALVPLNTMGRAQAQVIAQMQQQIGQMQPFLAQHAEAQRAANMQVASDFVSGHLQQVGLGSKYGNAFGQGTPMQIRNQVSLLQTADQMRDLQARQGRPISAEQALKAALAFLDHDHVIQHTRNTARTEIANGLQRQQTRMDVVTHGHGTTNAAPATLDDALGANVDAFLAARARG